MRDPKPRTLILAFGNDIQGDDAVGLAAARILKQELPEVEVVEVPGAGMDLLELCEGHTHALLLDAVGTEKHPPGTILHFSREDFQRVVAPSLHYAGLPEILGISEKLKLPFPKTFRILAIEIEKSDDFREGLGPEIQAALPQYVNEARTLIKSWSRQAACTNTH